MNLKKRQEHKKKLDTRVDELLKKNAKLKRKLTIERKVGQIKMFLFILSRAFTFMVCAIFVLQRNRKG